MNSSIKGLEANKTSINNSTPYCTHCNREGHIAQKCWKLHPELKKETKKSSNKRRKGKDNKDNNKPKDEESKSASPKVIMSASTTTTTSYAQNRSLETTKLVLDSGASEHFTPNKEWLLNYEELSNKTIIVANSAKAAILGKGNIPLLYKG
jgi:hypothetical protein